MFSPMLPRSPPKSILCAVGAFVLLCVISISSNHHSTFLGRDAGESRLSNDVYNSTFGVSLRAVENMLHSF